MNYRLRTCSDCGNKFSPTGGRQQRCRPCADARAQAINRDAQRRWKNKKARTPPSEIKPLRKAVCGECGTVFRTRRERAPLCPECLSAGNVEAEERLVVEPGACRSCRAHVGDARGIMRCPVLGGIECAAANPGHDCRLRVPEHVAADAEESVTETLVRRAGKLAARQRADIDALARLPSTRKTHAPATRPRRKAG